MSHSDTETDLATDMTASSIGGKYALRPSALSNLADYGRLGDTELDNVDKVINYVVNDTEMSNDNTNVDLIKNAKDSEFASKDMNKNSLNSNFTNHDMINDKMSHLNSDGNSATPAFRREGFLVRMVLLMAFLEETKSRLMIYLVIVLPSTGRNSAILISVTKSLN
ncbi:hypothetical protein JTE90_008311 [Oedothorax gibbosus]|uniref:Uncharacterized protein n=1 Tax=Oedothorax gibbosus TaxID=931172 RepID=A0AAV6TUI3_9ARAC|nr:hypothetical protein JTE90_008311 [Oedothorax gibbosus]